MGCERQDISIVKGVSKTLRLTVTDDDGARVDLTGATIYFCVKKTKADLTLEIALVSPTNIVILAQTGATLGQADIDLLPGDTSGLPVGQHVYDVWVEQSGGDRHAVVKPSSFFIEPSVTVL